ncbi:MAG: Methyltransferase type 11 [Bacteroidetes bacterium]|nr:Methyltransferase type 11 [Bacteroidota bacterium]
MEKVRKPFQGVGNIVRFNWHFYVLSIAGLIVLLLLGSRLSSTFHFYLNIGCLLISASIFISLLVSFYIYDLSGLYHFNWLNKLSCDGEIININAGFDETSDLLTQRFKNAKLRVLDFYDPVKHTEVSIKRARKAYPPFPGTLQINTTDLQLQSETTDLIFLIFAAHEIRDEQERIQFFKTLHAALRPGGQIYITEHLRDVPNFLAYNIGFFHFHSKATWRKTIAAADLQIHKELKHTPFISTFILHKNGNSF